MGKVIHVAKIGNMKLHYVECQDGSVTLALYVPGVVWAIGYARQDMGVYAAWGTEVPQFATDILSTLI
mgnify:CR=1 FL=1